MSYCRFAWGGSDVYVYESSDGIECCGCKLGGHFTAGMPEEMITHLGLHRRAGHYVPHEAVLALWEDIPGAQKPVTHEPTELTAASLTFTAAQLCARADELNKKQ